MLSGVGNPSVTPSEGMNGGYRTGRNDSEFRLYGKTLFKTMIKTEEEKVTDGYGN